MKLWIILRRFHMTLLSTEQLKDINRHMLGLGAPDKFDGAGYNKVDYTNMSNMLFKKLWSDEDIVKFIKTVLKYTSTQLKEYKADLQYTLEKYEVLVNTIKVVEVSRDSVLIRMPYNNKISQFIKKESDKVNMRWVKLNDNWALKVRWDYLNTLMTELSKENMILSEVEEAIKEKDSLQKTEEPAASFKVIRKKDSIDTLEAETQYNPKVVEVFHKIPHSYFNRRNNTWAFYIEQSAQLYKELSSLNVDLTQLKPWSDLVESWNVNSPSMIDLEKCNLKFKPYDFQVEDISKLLNLKVGLNANCMGLGKTFQSVVIGESIPDKKLVICPPTLRLNWKKEILHVNPEANVHIIYSDADFTTVDGWNIIGYSSLTKFLPQLEEEKFQVMFIDEAHFIQAVSNSGEPSSNRAFAVLRLAATSKYVYPITGTPKSNRNKNLFNILRTLRHPLARGEWSFFNYGKEYCDGQNFGYGWDFTGNSNNEKLNESLKPYMVRHLTKEVLPNLKKHRIVIPVSVDLKEYNKQIADYLSNRVNNDAEDLIKLMKAKRTLANQKATESIEFAKNLVEQNEKVVIVTCFTDVVKAVEKAFKNTCVKIVGGMSDSEKDKAITEFQNGKAQVMVMNIVAGGVGVTLTASHNMIINDFDWTPGNLAQAEDRICRSGQTEVCNIHYMYADGAMIDEIFVNTLTDKFENINSVVDNGLGDSIDYLKLINQALEKSV